MAGNITCPNCGHEFEPNEMMRKEIERQLRGKLVDWQKQREKQYETQLEDEKNKFQKEVEENLRKNIASDYENKLRMLQDNERESQEKLKEARQQQLEFLKKEQELKNREAELELSVQKKLQSEREKIAGEIRHLEEQRIIAKETEFQLRMKEMEEKLEAQRKLAEEMTRRAEQGSTQLYGETQELALEEMLKTAFPFDMVTEVGKGVRGADCIQTVRNNFGQECGRIIYESKRRQNFSNEWIDKLKKDMRSIGADVAVLVTSVMPKEMDCFGIREGVWVCNFSEVKALAGVLRDGVVRVFATAKSNENKGDKMHLLYGYLTSNEFAEQWKAIREGFMSMKLSIQKERDAMEKLWKSREKQLEKVLLNAAHIRGSIEGISGMEQVDLHLLETGEEEEE
jgi:hypothetical protein